MAFYICCYYFAYKILLIKINFYESAFQYCAINLLERIIYLNYLFYSSLNFIFVFDYYYYYAPHLKLKFYYNTFKLD